MNYPERTKIYLVRTKLKGKNDSVFFAKRYAAEDYFKRIVEASGGDPNQKFGTVAYGDWKFKNYNVQIRLFVKDLEFNAQEAVNRLLKK